MFDYIPQLLAGLILLSFAFMFCQILAFVWRWIGLNFFFKPPLETKNMSEAIWMKTAPLLIYFIILPFPVIAALGIWDIKSVSEPATYLIGLMIGSPLIWIGTLSVIAAIHITLLKILGRKRP